MIIVALLIQRCCRSSSFCAKYELFQTVKSLKYYRAINDRLSEISPRKTIYYENQTVIPNQLKATTVARSMLLYQIDNVGEYPLDEIISKPIKMSIDIHVSMGSGELLSLWGNDQQQSDYHMTPVQCCKSYSIMQYQTVSTRFTLLATTVPIKMAIDIHSTIPEVPAILTELPDPEGYDFEFSTVGCEYLDSFVKRNLSLIEMRNRVLFIDASCAKDIHDNWVPIALCVIDYYGKVLINTIICPRTHIKDYNEKSHGLVEENIIGTPDSEDMMKYFYSTIWDKIVVGHNLRVKIRYLKINMRFVCGIRDLKSCVEIRRFFNSSKRTFKLHDIASRILNQPGQKNLFTALENCQTIRNIYLAVEKQTSNFGVNDKDYMILPNGQGLRCYGPL